MRKNLFSALLLFSLFSLLSSCGSDHKEKNGVPTVIKGTILQSNAAIVYLFDSYQYTTVGERYGLLDSTILDSEGNFSLQADQIKASFYKVRLGDDLLMGGMDYELFMEPGDTVVVEWDTQNGINDQYSIMGGNQPLYAQYTVDERKFFDLDSFNQAKTRSILSLEPINAGQMNNSLKVDLTLYKKGYLSSKYVHGEFERYIAKKNDYLHAGRALRYIFDSPLRSVTNTRIIFTNMSHFFFTDHTSTSDEYLLFMKPFRDYSFYMKWLGVHYQLSVDPDSIFEQQALKTYVDLVAKEDRGKILACNLWHARNIYPLVWSQPTFFNQLDYLQEVLQYDSTESVWKQSATAMNQQLMQWRPGTTIKNFTAEDLKGNRWSTDVLKGNTLLYVWNHVLPNPKAVTFSNPEGFQVLHLYLAPNQSDIASWRSALIDANNFSESVSHIVMHGDEARSWKKYFCMMESVQGYILLNNQVARPFIKVFTKDNFVPHYH